MGMQEAKKPMDFHYNAAEMQEDCSVADLKMSDYGIKPEEFVTMAKNAKDTMGFLFTCDRREIDVDECVAIYRESYK